MLSTKDGMDDGDYSSSFLYYCRKWCSNGRKNSWFLDLFGCFGERKLFVWAANTVFWHKPMLCLFFLWTWSEILVMLYAAKTQIESQSKVTLFAVWWMSYSLTCFFCCKYSVTRNPVMGNSTIIQIIKSGSQLNEDPSCKRTREWRTKERARDTNEGERYENQK